MEINLAEIDKNLITPEYKSEEGIKFYDVRKKPFTLYGFHDIQTRPFVRMPEEVASAISPGMVIMSKMTVGCRVRFKTDSEYIAIKVTMPQLTPLTPFGTLAAMKGFDLYINDELGSHYFKTFTPPIEIDCGYESKIILPSKMERDITIHFPMYNTVEDLFIGLDKSATLSKGNEYKYKKPVLFYGSSITQGGCVTRTGNVYASIISTKLDCDIVNLGNSGGAKAEDAFADYIATRDMSVFVYDYDHNAPNADYLRKTHKRFFERIRKSQPKLPVIMITKPDEYDKQRQERWEIIHKTYTDALETGDKNVYFIDGYTFFDDENRDIYTADGCHPNDFGHFKMAEIIGAEIKKLL